MGNGQIRTKKVGNSNRFQKNEFIPNGSLYYFNYEKWFNNGKLLITYFTKVKKYLKHKNEKILLMSAK